MTRHVIYERAMFATAVELCGQWPARSPFLNVAVEACVLHFRALDSFFLAASPQGDDVHVSDYLTEWAPPASAVIFSRLRTRAHKQVAHLSWRRLRFKGPDWDWPLKEMLAGVNDSWSTFEAALAEERRAWFRLDDEEIAVIAEQLEREGR